MMTATPLSIIHLQLAIGARAPDWMALVDSAEDHTRVEIAPDAHLGRSI